MSLKLRRQRIQLENEIQFCARCKLSEYSVNEISKVFGNGNCINPTHVFIGIAPSYKSESTIPEPNRAMPPRAFQHGGGFKFRQLLKTIGIYESSYITNMLKCATPKNRKPKEKEIAACTLWFRQEVALLKPKVIVAAGNVVFEWLEKCTKRLSECNIIFDGRRIKLFRIYHPSYCYSYKRVKEKEYERLIKDTLGLL